MEKLVKKLGGVTDVQSPAKQKNKKRKKKAKIVKREPSPINVPVEWTNEIIDLT